MNWQAHERQGVLGGSEGALEAEGVVAFSKYEWKFESQIAAGRGLRRAEDCIRSFVGFLLADVVSQCSERMIVRANIHL